MKVKRQSFPIMLIAGAIGMLLLFGLHATVAGSTHPGVVFGYMLRSVNSDPGALAGLGVYLLVGVLIGAIAVLTLSSVRTNRVKMGIGSSALVLGVLAGIMFALLCPSLWGLELPVMLFGLLLLIPGKAEEEKSTS